MTTYGVPTLGDSLYLTEPGTKLTYLIRTYSILPSNVMPVLSNNVLSLSGRVAQYGSNPDNLCQIVTDDLTQLLKKNFPDGIPDVLVTYTAQDNGWYSVTMSATIQINGQTYQGDYTHTVVNNTVVLPNDQVSYL